MQGLGGWSYVGGLTKVTLNWYLLRIGSVCGGQVHYISLYIYIWTVTE